MRQLIDQLPEHFRTIEEFIEIMGTAQVETDLLFEERYKILDNQFLETANATGLSRFEKIYSVKGNSALSDEDRRFALKTFMIEQRPTTLNFLKKQLALLCGEGGFEIIPNFDGFEIDVRLALAKSENLNAVKTLIQKIIPANMYVTVDILYNRYEDMEEKTYDWLNDYDYNEIKEMT